jgi:glycosyltransferase involved in cell wall biosynthesis
LPETLVEIARWVSAQPDPVEVLVVENGSTDRTVEVTRDFGAEHPYVRLMAGLARGKGTAVRAGMLEARGRLRFLCDADLSMPIGQVQRLVDALARGNDIALGSREVAGARRHGEPPYRHLMGRVFNFMVKVLAVPGVEDTQCGFKLFSAESAREVFASARLAGWGFDAEVLHIARKRGYRLVEVGVDWYYNDDSRVRPVADSLGMVKDLLLIRWNDARGYYDRAA